MNVGTGFSLTENISQSINVKPPKPMKPTAPIPPPGGNVENRQPPPEPSEPAPPVDADAGNRINVVV